MMKRAEDFLAEARFDATSKNFTLDKFFGHLRRAFHDLGPNDQLSEQRKVMKLRAAFQVPGLEHLDAMIAANPQLNSNFEAAVTFLSENFASMKTKNTSRRRNLSSIHTGNDGNGNGNGNQNGRPHKGPRPNAKHKIGGGGKGGGFDPKNPGKYLKGGAWAKLSADQKAKAAKARKAAGIKTREERQLGALEAERELSALNARSEPGSGMEVDSDDESEVEEVAQAVRELQMTQRKVAEIKSKREAEKKRKAQAAKKAARLAKAKAAKAGRSS